MGQIEGLLGAVLRVRQGLAPIEFRAVSSQCLLGLLEGLQYDAVEARERGGCGGFGLGHARSRQGLVRETPADARTHAPGTRAIRGELVELYADAAEKAGETDARIQVGGGNADARRGGGNLPFGVAYIGAPLEQRGAVTDGDERIEARRG